MKISTLGTTATCLDCGLALEPGAPCPRCLLGVGLGQDDAALEDLVGRTIEGKYRVERPLGRGGMGAVYLATHLGTERPVALKVLAPDLTDEEEFVERFRREAKAAGRLRHPNIVNVTDFGVADLGEDGELAYLVMEYLDGESLAEHVARRRERSLAWIADVVEQIAAAVDEAHRHGVIHRDLKPGNIWLVPNGRGGHTVKVLDFGLAKLRATDDAAIAPPAPSEDETPTLALPNRVRRPGLWHSAARRTAAGAGATIPGAPPSEADGLTRFGSLLGTPHYMSPEQCRGERLDGRSDVYSLGVVAYELLTGRPPFEGDAEALVAQHLDREPRPPRLALVSLPANVDGPVLAALAKRPEDRPRTAGAFARSLEASLTASQEDERSSFGQAFAIYGADFWPLLLRSPFTGIVPYAVSVGLAARFVDTGRFLTDLPVMAVCVFAGLAVGGLANAAAVMPIVARSGVWRGEVAALDVPRARWRNLPSYVLAVVRPANRRALFAVWVCLAVALQLAERPPASVGIVFACTMWAVFGAAASRLGVASSVALFERGGAGDTVRRADALANRLYAVYKKAYSGGEALVGTVTTAVVVVAVAYLPDTGGADWGAWLSVHFWALSGVALALFLNPILGVCTALKYVEARRLGGEAEAEADEDEADDDEPAEYWWERTGPERYTELVLRPRAAASFAIVAIALFTATYAAFLALPVTGLAGIGVGLVTLAPFLPVLVLAYKWTEPFRTTVDDEAVAVWRPTSGTTRVAWDDVTQFEDVNGTITLRGPEGKVSLSPYFVAGGEELRAYVAHQLRRHDKVL